MTLFRPTPALAGLLALSLFTGCSTGSRDASSSGTAPSTSHTPAALPHPGGQIVAVTPGANPVQATLQTDVYTAFGEGGSVSDLALTADRAFVLEDRGRLRILDLSGATPALDRAIDLFGAPLQAGIATGALTLQSSTLALLTTSGTGGEGVALFDPSAVQSAQDVTWFDFGALSATWPVGTTNSKGVDVGGQPLPLTYTAAAVHAGGRLIFASSNFDANFDLNPGAVTAYPLDLTTRTLSTPGALVQTSDFNPTGLTRVETAKGELVLVTNAGPMGQAGSIDVLDPVTMIKVGTIRFPAAATNPAGTVAVSPDGTRGYVGAQSDDCVYLLDLAGLGDLVGATAAADLSARFLGGYELGAAAGPSYISRVALSHSGDYLYAVDMNASALYVLDLTRPELGATVSGFARSGLPSNFEGLASLVAVRPGEPGVDFQGPSVYVLTINLAAADRAIANVSVALDAVTVDRH